MRYLRAILIGHMNGRIKVYITMTDNSTGSIEIIDLEYIKSRSDIESTTDLARLFSDMANDFSTQKSLTTTESCELNRLILELKEEYQKQVAQDEHGLYTSLLIEKHS